MYQYDSNDKSQSEKSKATAPAANKSHAQAGINTPFQTKSFFSPSANHKNSSIKMNNTGIPAQMKERFESMSGFSFDDVRVHYNSDKPAQLQSLAYTQGNQVYVAPGQEKHLGHELGHVVQQKSSTVKPTAYIDSNAVNDSPSLESEADRLANLQGIKAARLPGSNSVNIIQRKVSITIRDNNYSCPGESGKRDDTDTNMRKLPDLRNAFIASVATKTVVDKDDAEVDRPWNQCAEPNALSNLVAKYDEAGTLANIDFGKIHFPQLAYNHDTGKYMIPCDVCKQWVEEVGGNKLIIKDTLKRQAVGGAVPINPDFQKERYLSYFGGYSIALEDDLSSKAYEERFKFFTDRKADADELSSSIKRKYRTKKIPYDMFSHLIQHGIKDISKAEQEIGGIVKYEGDDVFGALVKKINELRQITKFLDLGSIKLDTGTPEDKANNLVKLNSIKPRNIKDKAEIIKKHMDVTLVGQKLNCDDYIYWQDVADIILSFSRGEQTTIMGWFGKFKKTGVKTKYLSSLNRIKELSTYFLINGCTKEDFEELSRRVTAAKISELSGPRKNVSEYLIADKATAPVPATKS